MPVLKQTSLVRMVIQLLFIGLTMTVLFSCSKEKSLSEPVAQTISPSVSSNASDKERTNVIPFEKTIFVSCANGGVGEYVSITGLTHLIYTISWTDRGFTYGYHANAYKIEGVGLSSGENFKGSGNTEGQVYGSWVNDHWVSNLDDRLRLTSANTSFILINKYKISVTPAGEVTASLDEQETTCK